MPQPKRRGSYCKVITLDESKQVLRDSDGPGETITHGVPRNASANGSTVTGMVTPAGLSPRSIASISTVGPRVRL